ncbi:sulfotransferase 1B1 [Plutella xylostella]|uniref:sulfotransferase 1B1 n=1 Tax=Plutella xylostella TaxID=51655 RepID=UPI0020325AF3|nr:sulfotransferase 1B1 [Plutella xylostella]
MELEPLKCEKLPEKDRERVRNLYCRQSMPSDLMLVGDGRYCMIEHSYKELERRSLRLRPDDVWIGGFARSGTHWLAELTWLVTNNLDVDAALNEPFVNRVHYYDYGRPRSYFEGLCSPRYLQTHLAPSLLPPRLLDSCRVVYVIRDPRDVLVSCYHFFSSHTDVGFLGDLKQFYELFKEGYVVYTPYFTYLKEFLAQKHHQNLLILFYEDMKKDIKTAAKQVAEFFHRDYTDEQLDRICEHLDISTMKQNKAINSSDVLGDKGDEMVRKGEAGAWREEFDEFMIKDAEKWLAENFQDTDCKQRYVNQ